MFAKPCPSGGLGGDGGLKKHAGWQDHTCPLQGIQVLPSHTSH